MIWFALILALILGVVVGLFTRNLRKAFLVGLISFIAGVLISILIVYSGIMGG